MCGIFGVLGGRSGLDWSLNYGRMRHRGPDASGEYEDEECFLAHTRLAIIDLSSAANQPMRSRCDRYVLVFNGEIFNYLDLRHELIAKEVSINTNSDTEVLLNLFIERGTDFLRDLDGMFAFVIWDRRDKVLFGARDHAGIKPLFFHHASDHFSFASEIKALSGVARLEVDDSKIYEYLQYGYVPAPGSMFHGVKSLSPGSAFRYNLSSNELKMWDWRASPSVIDHSINFEEAVDVFRQKFRESVKRRCIADVPLGAFLSGGLDSSAIVVEMLSESRSVETYSIGYAENHNYDETRYAKLVANHLGTNHTTIYPEIPSADLEAYIDCILDNFDQPYANPTVMMLHLLTKRVKAEATVALIGDGGDEILAGYSRHRALQLHSRHRSWLRCISTPVLKALNLMGEVPGSNHGRRRMRQFFESSHRTDAEAYADWNSIIGHADLRRHTPDWQRDALGAANSSFLKSLFEQSSGDCIARALQVDQQSFLPFNLMDGADRMSMANSFELRLPFLSYELMDFLNSLPSNFKIQGGVQKRILKHAYKDILPEEILHRPKRGFNPPVWDWLHQSRSVVLDILSSGCLVERYLDRQFIRALTSDLFLRKRDTSLQVWSLLVLERWLQREKVNYR